MAFAASWVANNQYTPKNLGDTANGGADVVYLGSEEVIFQSRSNNCGVAALLMVLEHHGVKSLQQEIKQRAELLHRGTSLLALKELAKRADLEAEGWRLSFEDLKKIVFPAILFIENYHFIVVDSVDGRGVLFVRDPAVGRLAIPRRRMMEIWNGETLVITRASR